MPGQPDQLCFKQQVRFSLGQAEWECASIVSGPKVAEMGSENSLGAAEWVSDVDHLSLETDLTRTYVDY